MKKLPILLLVLALFAVLYFELHQYFTLDMLKEHHRFLFTWNQHHQILAALIFIGLYIAAVALSFPIAMYLNVTAGFLFGLVGGTIYSVVGAGVGATLLFLAINTAFGDWLESKASAQIQKLERGFQRNAFNYLLTLRLIPVIPFWVTNIAAALLNVSLRTFVIATFIGIIPETALVVWMGSGLEQMFATGQTPTLDMLFVPSIIIPLSILAILPLTPLIYKKICDLRKSG